MEQEGVIKYQLNYRKTGVCVTAPEISEINAWRSILHRLDILGQNPDRYQGYGFGNVSVRLKPCPHPSFIISGTQTGAINILEASHYCCVLSADPLNNSLTAEGPVRPSSEALTHAAIYAEKSSIVCVMHVHSPEIWRNYEALGIMSTGQQIAYGTPEMAAAIQALVQLEAIRRQGIFVMAGHEDGVISFASTVASAGKILIHYLSLALSLE